MKRTYQPSNIKRKRTHGFRKRRSTVGGRNVLANRRRKGRKRLTVWWMKDCRLRKSERLLKRGQFDKVLSMGRKRRVGRDFILYTLPNGLDRKRLGIIASKKIGNAVIRNRTKRKIREAYRRLKGQLQPAMDIVVISGKDLLSLPNSIFEKKLIENLSERRG